jgi:hypothetical protein
MPKTVKLFNDNGHTTRQLKREPGAMTLQMVYGHQGGQPLFDLYHIKLDSAPAQHRLVSANAVLIRYTDINESNDYSRQEFYSTAQQAAEVLKLKDGYEVISESPNGIHCYRERPFKQHRFIDISTGQLQHKQANLGDGVWFGIDAGYVYAATRYYDENITNAKPLPGRWNGADMPPRRLRVNQHNPNELISIEQWDEQQIPIRAAADAVIAARVAAITARATAAAAPARAAAAAQPKPGSMPIHVKQMIVDMAIELNKSWCCCVCVTDQAPNVQMLTDCGHYLCFGCQFNWKAQERGKGKATWACPECRCEH